MLFAAIITLGAPAQNNLLFVDFKVGLAAPRYGIATYAEASEEAATTGAGKNPGLYAGRTGVARLLIPSVDRVAVRRFKTAVGVAPVIHHHTDGFADIIVNASLITLAGAAGADKRN